LTARPRSRPKTAPDAPAAQPAASPANASAADQPAPKPVFSWASQLLSIKVLRRPLESAQYTSIDYTQTLADHGVLASVGSVGDAYDNALAESFVDSFKTELTADRVWRTRAQLELAVVEYIGWFNDGRLHQALGDLPPSEFERLSHSSSLEISLC
jgi:putative transposase